MAAAPEELPLGGVGREGQCGVIGLQRGGVAAESAQQVGADGVKQVVTLELEVIEGGQAVRGPVDLAQLEAGTDPRVERY